MHKQLSFYVEPKLIPESHISFKVGRFTTNAVTKAFDSKNLQPFHSKSLLNLTKAFNCVPFTYSIKKLKLYGISQNSCKVVISYLEKTAICLRERILLNNAKSHNWATSRIRSCTFLLFHNHYWFARKSHWNFNPFFTYCKIISKYKTKTLRYWFCNLL